MSSTVVALGSRFPGFLVSTALRMLRHGLDFHLTCAIGRLLLLLLGLCLRLLDLSEVASAPVADRGRLLFLDWGLLLLGSFLSLFFGLKSLVGAELLVLLL